MVLSVILRRLVILQVSKQYLTYLLARHYTFLIHTNSPITNKKIIASCDTFFPKLQPE